MNPQRNKLKKNFGHWPSIVAMSDRKLDGAMNRLEVTVKATMKKWDDGGRYTVAMPIYENEQQMHPKEIEKYGGLHNYNLYCMFLCVAIREKKGRCALMPFDVAEYTKFVRSASRYDSAIIRAEWALVEAAKARTMNAVHPYQIGNAATATARSHNQQP
ncbi:MAG: hypothetical protein V3V10_01330 [Planctomycetota bacterium]